MEGRMKKILSFIFICTFIFVLVGCGKKEDTLTCTKGSDKIVITFKNDMTTKISTTQTFNNEESAKEFEEILKANPSKRAIKTTTITKPNTANIASASPFELSSTLFNSE